jgi:hypothetical protein
MSACSGCQFFITCAKADWLGEFHAPRLISVYLQLLSICRCDHVSDILSAFRWKARGVWQSAGRSIDADS